MLQKNEKGMFSKFGNSEVDGVPNKDEESNVTSPLFGVVIYHDSHEYRL